MRPTRNTLLAIAALGLLQACSGAQVNDSSMVEATPEAVAAASGAGTAAAAPAREPELTLNLPDQECDCSEAAAPGRDFTFFERGFKALVEGDHIEAVQHFQRYQRLEQSPVADWEASVAIAFISTLQHSPFYDPDDARKSSRRLNKQRNKRWKVDERALLMALSLESFRVMYRHMDDLEDVNKTLREDLRKREEALKRLRELTLGQKGARQ